MGRDLAIVVLAIMLSACCSYTCKFDRSVIAYRNDAAMTARSCVNDYECALQNEVSDIRIKELEELDLDACKAKGGLIDGIGLFGEPACVVRFSDGGKRCIDSSQCEGDCMVYGEIPAGGGNQGKCASQTPEPGGCFARLVNGRAEKGICI